ncbi:MAG: prepilin-type N-terminal cleavage/methylation domain-containing protein [Xanthomonadaceae bacterium]|nr:prepilin-type N-terminal cleavage/methylation domain-containing protein [Xanthomonadaceae bacterium]
MKLKILKNQSGFTLVELMITTGLFGYCALMAGTLFAEGMRLVVTARAQADFNQQLISFNDSVDTYIANTTRVRSCLCGNDGLKCLYDASYGSGTFPTDGSRVPGGCDTYSANGSDSACDFLDFDSDTAMNPGQEATGNCIGNTGWEAFTGKAVATQTTDSLAVDYQLYPKGCKERFKLRWIPPTKNSESGGVYTVGVPGEIQMVKISLSGVETVMARVQGVYAFQCGFDAINRRSTSIGGIPPTVDDRGAATGFRLDIEAKTRRSQVPFGAANVVESWAPQEVIPDQFTKGLHRVLSLNIQFRNLAAESIQFGRTVSFRGCQPDNTASLTGDCCSGYIDRGTGLCMPKTLCKTAGTTIAKSDWEQCCSHVVSNINMVEQCI